MRSRSVRMVTWPKLFWGITLSVLIVVGALGTVFYTQRKWDGQTRFTVIVLSQPIQVKSLDPKSGQGIILILPKDLEIESVGGRGKWLASMITKAGGATWVADSVADYLAVAYQGVEGSLGLWDNLAWRKAAGAAQWRTIDLAETPYVQKEQTPDGITVLHLASGWEAKARDWFSDSAIAQQVLGINVVNTSQVSGLGGSAARTVESMGFKVRSLTTGAPELNQCLVKSPAQMKKSAAVRKLLVSFNCKWSLGEAGDLNLELGRQYSKWKTGSE